MSPIFCNKTDLSRFWFDVLIPAMAPISSIGLASALNTSWSSVYDTVTLDVNEKVRA